MSVCVHAFMDGRGIVLEGIVNRYYGFITYIGAGRNTLTEMNFLYIFKVFRRSSKVVYALFDPDSLNLQKDSNCSTRLDKIEADGLFLRWVK